MGRLPHLVRDSELETHFSPTCDVEKVHTYHERSPNIRGKLVARREHWQILKKVGGGGFGSAVKQMEINRWSTRLDYNRELEAIAKFSHRKYERCFVKSFGWYKSDEHLFIAMEYLELGDFQSYLQNNPKLPEIEVREIIFQVLDGLNLMHDNEFTHRDLKLNNILIKDGPPNNWWVKISDFGISKRVEDATGLPTTIKGTPGYLAPELIAFTNRGMPYAVDIWAVGEITFQLLTKNRPSRIMDTFLPMSTTPAIFLTIPSILTAPQNLGLTSSFPMHPEPNQRISARDASKHQWMEQSLPSPHEPRYGRQLTQG
ncbi:kinase-like domain-containing protein [Aspergillus insuetus]